VQADGSPITRRIAVIGAGPSGLYAVERITRVDPGARVDIFEKLPTPFGLVRYGVAPDHQGTKAVSRVLERVLDKPTVRFFGNVEVGRDVTLNDLRAAYDGVLVAVGATCDRKLGLPGEDKAGVLGSWEFVAWLNGMPDVALRGIDFSQIRNVVIIGLGNVAIDVARTFLKPGDAFAGSDLHDEASEALAGSVLEQVTILGRGQIDDARFGQGELAELLNLPGITHAVTPAVAPTDRSTTAQVLRNPAGAGSRRLTFRFGAAPVEFRGGTRVEAVRFQTATGQEEIAADLVISCIGFDCAPLAEFESVQGRLPHSEYCLADGVFVTGWAADGPRGTIASSRVASHAVIDRMLALIPLSGRPGLVPSNAVDLAGWRRIDAAERAAAKPDRCRAKITTRKAMLEVAGCSLRENGENGVCSDAPRSSRAI
jgi:ferredoxin--NADP+ reductase